MTLVGTSLALAQASQQHRPVNAQSETLRTQSKRPNIILIITDQERYPRHWPDDWAFDNLPAHKRLME